MFNLDRNVAKKSAIGEQKRKKMHKRVALLELLEPDLVENDPRVGICYDFVGGGGVLDCGCYVSCDSDFRWV